MEVRFKPPAIGGPLIDIDVYIAQRLNHPSEVCPAGVVEHYFEHDIPGILTCPFTRNIPVFGGATCDVTTSTCSLTVA